MGDDDLARKPSGPRGRKRKIPTPEERVQSASPVERLYGYFEQKFLAQWHVPMIVDQARDRGILAGIVEQLGEAGAQQLIDAFFEAVKPVRFGGDPVVAEHAWRSNLMDLKYHAQYLLLKRTRPRGVASRTSNNIHEGLKAMGKGRK